MYSLPDLRITCRPNFRAQLVLRTESEKGLGAGNHGGWSHSKYISSHRHGVHAGRRSQREAPYRRIWNYRGMRMPDVFLYYQTSTKTPRTQSTLNTIFPIAPGLVEPVPCLSCIHYLSRLGFSRRNRVVDVAASFSTCCSRADTRVVWQEHKDTLDHGVLQVFLDRHRVTGGRKRATYGLYRTPVSVSYNGPVARSSG